MEKKQKLEKKVKNKKKHHFSKEKVLNGLQKIFREFHNELSTRLKKVTKEKRIFFLTEFGKLYYSIKEKCENTYKSNIAKDNEFLIIPFFHNSLKKVFENFTVDLEKKFFEFVEKTKYSIDMHENLDKNFCVVLEEQILHTKTLGEDLERYFLKKREFDMVEKEDHIGKRDGFNKKLKSVVENQQKINVKIQAISDRLSNLENKNGDIKNRSNFSFGNGFGNGMGYQNGQNFMGGQNQQVNYGNQRAQQRNFSFGK